MADSEALRSRRKRAHALPDDFQISKETTEKCRELGITAAELVKSGAKDLIENPFYLTQRPSL